MTSTLDRELLAIWTTTGLASNRLHPTSTQQTHLGVSRPVSLRPSPSWDRLADEREQYTAQDRVPSTGSSSPAFSPCAMRGKPHTGSTSQYHISVVGQRLARIVGKIGPGVGRGERPVVRFSRERVWQWTNGSSAQGEQLHLGRSFDQHGQ